MAAGHVRLVRATGEDVAEAIRRCSTMPQAFINGVHLHDESYGHGVPRV
jgi:hypothetical protein